MSMGGPPDVGVGRVQAALDTELTCQLAQPLAADGPLPGGFSLEGYLGSLERQLIDRALTEAHGVKKDAAAKLGLPLEERDVGEGGLERRLEELVEGAHV